MHTILDERDKMKFDEELKNIEDNVIVVSKTGEVINVNDGADEPLKGLRVFGKTEQKPISGNNVLRYPYTESSVSKNGVDFIDNGDGSVTIKGTPSSDTFFGITRNTIEDRWTLKAGTYTLSTNIKPDSYFFSFSTLRPDGSEDSVYLNGIDTHITFTINEDRECFMFIVVRSGKNADFTITPMLNAGSTALPWEPYVGGIPSPNPEYPQELVSAGKDGSIDVGVYGENLLPYPYTFNTLTTGGLTYTSNEDGSITVSGTKTGTSYFNLIGSIINDYATEKIVFRKNIYTLIENGYKLSARLTDGTYINGITTDNIKNKSIGALYVEATYANNTVVNDVIHPLISYANIKEWKPYKDKQSLTIPYTLCGIPITDASLANYIDENGQMWCSDEVDLERGVYVQRVGVVKPDDWEKTNIADGTSGHRYRAFVPTIKGVRTPLLSNCYVAKSVSSFGTEGDYLSIDETSSGKVVIRTTDENLGTIDKFKAFANEKNLEVYYIIETPIETPLSEEEIAAYKALKMNYPNTTILNDSNAHIEVKYTADVQNHIEQNYVSKAEYEAAMSQVSMIETAML